jgi:hypothetical protein
VLGAIEAATLVLGVAVKAQADGSSAKLVREAVLVLEAEATRLAAAPRLDALKRQEEVVPCISENADPCGPRFA